MFIKYSLNGAWETVNQFKNRFVSSFEVKERNIYPEIGSHGLEKARLDLHTVFSEA